MAHLGGCQKALPVRITMRPKLTFWQWFVLGIVVLGIIEGAVIIYLSLSI